MQAYARGRRVAARLMERSRIVLPASDGKQGSQFRVPAGTVVAAIGQGPNPALQRETPQLVTKRGKIVIDTNAKTSMESVFAGGDVVRGGSTVILAMHDGRQAAQAIDANVRRTRAYLDQEKKARERHECLAGLGQ